MIKKRDKVSLAIDVSLEELEQMEDFHTCIPLCDKHKGQIVEGTTRELDTMWYECEDCKKVHDRWFKGAMKIEGRLFKEYFRKHSDVFIEERI